MSYRILLVEDAPSLWDGARGCVLPEDVKGAERVGWSSFKAPQIRRGCYSLMIVNAVAGGEAPQRFFEWLRGNTLPCPVFAVLPVENEALMSLAAGAVDDFLLWPAHPEELARRVHRFLGAPQDGLSEIERRLTAEIGMREMVGQDAAFLSVMAKVARFGATDAPVLLTGETGTGKELCARVTHLLSQRSHGPFIPIDCGALPDHLFENELFGHARGAFTDARTDQKGLVAVANGGTLFLDEIDSLSLVAQSKVLRLLQERTYRPLGSETFKKAEVRIIAATNRNLEQLVSEKTFRSDLYFRINVLRIQLPSLRERRSDIGLLGRHFVDEMCSAQSLPRKVLSEAALRRLESHDWPGNVRELYNVMQRAVLSSDGAQIAASNIEVAEDVSEELPLETDLSFRRAKLEAIRSFERDYVARLMQKHLGNVTRAAREAGKDRRAFGRLASKYGVQNSAM